jgi:VCBS repeat-containing protein
MPRRHGRLFPILTAMLAMVATDVSAQSGPWPEGSLRGTVPVVGSAPGAFGSQFRTEMQINNPSALFATGWIVLRPAGFAAPDVARRYELAPRETLVIADVVAELGHEGLGSLDIVVDSGATPVVVARAFDDAPDGTRGVMLPLLGADEAIGRGGATALVIPADSEHFRFNIGVRAVEEGAILEMIVFDGSGNVGGQTGRIARAPHHFEQRAARQWFGLDALPAEGLVLVRVYAGSAFIYGTTTDNRTNDPSLQIETIAVEPPELADGGSEIHATMEVGERRVLRLRFAETGPLSPIVISGPSHGIVHRVGQAPGGVVEVDYQPAAEYEGPDEIVLLVENAWGAFVEITIRISVTDTVTSNHPPSGLTLSPSSIEERRLPGTVVGLFSTVDPDPADTHTYALVKGDGDAHNALFLIGGNQLMSAAMFDFEHQPELFVRVRTTDSEGLWLESSFVVTVLDVNDPPIANDDFYTVVRGGTLTVGRFAGVLSNDTDQDSPVLTAHLENGPNFGSVTLNQNGAFTYVHDGSNSASDSFTYGASDEFVGSEPATVKIAITVSNAAPVARDDDYKIETGSVLDVPAAVGVLKNDSDAEGAVLEARLVSPPARGRLTFRADGSFTYEHDGGRPASQSFTYRATDGQAESNVATVLLTGITQNTPPVALADVYSVAHAGRLHLAAPGVLANDHDADGDDLTTVLVSRPVHGALTLNPDGSFTYVHDGTHPRIDHFSYKAHDGQDASNTVTVTIDIRDRTAPRALIVSGETYAISRNEVLRVEAPGILTNDVSEEGDGLTTILGRGPLHGTLGLNPDGSFVYVPALDFVGNDSFGYLVTDGVEVSRSVTTTISVTP